MVEVPLPSWQDGAPKRTILAFVSAAVDEDGDQFVPPAERIATFDNDGTLWGEQPLYFQFLFAVDRVRALAPDHPEWRDQPAFRAVLDDDRAALGALTKHDLAGVLAAAHAGMTTDEFAGVVRDWVGTARHPRFGQPYTRCVYQPMLELLDYLRANGFQTWIVSGGGVDFMRVFAEEVYGIPPAQVIGSSGKVRFEPGDGRSVLVKLPELGSFDDKEVKPANIHLHVGNRPVLAAGNSDGDLAMLQYATGQPGPSLALIVDHDDAEREYAYRVSKMGSLEAALAEADRRGWTVVSIKDDWRRVFPFDA